MRRGPRWLNICTLLVLLYFFLAPASYSTVLNQSLIDYYTSEVAYLARLGSRVTGTLQHSHHIDHIQRDLESLGLKVLSQDKNFTYNNAPISPPKLFVGDKEVPISSVHPYSGNTDRQGITGRLVDLTGTPISNVNWSQAAGAVAVVNLTLKPAQPQLPLWPGFKPWPVLSSSPTNSIGGITHLTSAKKAGVKGVIWVWHNTPTGTADGQYLPFTNPYEDLPAIFTAGDGAKLVMQAARDTYFS